MRSCQICSLIAKERVVLALIRTAIRSNSDILTNCGDLTKRVKGEVVCQLSVTSLFYKNGGGGDMPTCIRHGHQQRRLSALVSLSLHEKVHSNNTNHLSLSFKVGGTKLLFPM